MYFTISFLSPFLNVEFSVCLSDYRYYVSQRFLFPFLVIGMSFYLFSILICQMSFCVSTLSRVETSIFLFTCNLMSDSMVKSGHTIVYINRSGIPLFIRERHHLYVLPRQKHLSLNHQDHFKYT